MSFLRISLLSLSAAVALGVLREADGQNPDCAAIGENTLDFVGAEKEEENEMQPVVMLQSGARLRALNAAEHLPTPEAEAQAKHDTLPSLAQVPAPHVEGEVAPLPKDQIPQTVTVQLHGTNGSQVAEVASNPDMSQPAPAGQEEAAPSAQDVAETADDEVPEAEAADPTSDDTAPVAQAAVQTFDIAGPAAQATAKASDNVGAAANAAVQTGGNATSQGPIFDMPPRRFLKELLPREFQKIDPNGMLLIPLGAIVLVIFTSVIVVAVFLCIAGTPYKKDDHVYLAAAQRAREDAQKDQHLLAGAPQAQAGATLMKTAGGLY